MHLIYYVYKLFILWRCQKKWHGVFAVESERIHRYKAHTLRVTLSGLCKRWEWRGNISKHFYQAIIQAQNLWSVSVLYFFIFIIWKYFHLFCPALKTPGLNATQQFFPGCCCIIHFHKQSSQGHILFLNSWQLQGVHILTVIRIGEGSALMNIHKHLSGFSTLPCTKRTGHLQC